MMTGFASRNIRKGEEITDCYSYPFDITKLVDRLVQSGFIIQNIGSFHLKIKLTTQPIIFLPRSPDLLKKYKFQCGCIACKEKWLTFHDLPS